MNKMVQKNEAATRDESMVTITGEKGEGLGSIPEREYARATRGWEACNADTGREIEADFRNMMRKGGDRRREKGRWSMPQEMMELWARNLHLDTNLDKHPLEHGAGMNEQFGEEEARRPFGIRETFREDGSLAQEGVEMRAFLHIADVKKAKGRKWIKTLMDRTKEEEQEVCVIIALKESMERELEEGVKREKERGSRCETKRLLRVEARTFPGEGERQRKETMNR